MCCVCTCLHAVLQASRSPSSSNGSANGEDTPSPKSHTTQLINLTEMQQLSAQEQLDDAAAHQQQQQFAQQQAQMQQLQQQLERQSLDGVQVQQSRSLAAVAPQQPLSDSQLQQLAPAAGLGTRLLGSSEFSGDQELDAERLQLLTDEELLATDEDRDLCVNCQQAEENKLSFQLKFTEPEGR